MHCGRRLAFLFQSDSPGDHPPSLGAALDEEIYDVGLFLRNDSGIFFEDPHSPIHRDTRFPFHQTIGGQIARWSRERPAFSSRQCFLLVRVHTVWVHDQEVCLARAHALRLRLR